MSDELRDAGGFGEKLRVRALVGGDEQPCRFLHGASDGEEAVVLQDHELVRAQGLGDVAPFLLVEDHTVEIGVERVAAVERGGVLGDRVEQPAEGRPCLTGHGMGVRRGDDVRTGGVHLGVDGERGRVDGTVADHDVAVVVDQ